MTIPTISGFCRLGASLMCCAILAAPSPGRATEMDWAKLILGSCVAEAPQTDFATAVPDALRSQLIPVLEMDTTAMFTHDTGASLNLGINPGFGSSCAMTIPNSELPGAAWQTLSDALRDQLTRWDADGAIETLPLADGTLWTAELPSGHVVETQFAKQGDITLITSETREP